MGNIGDLFLIFFLNTLQISVYCLKLFDDKKALIATVVSVLKPGKTNTVSINDNDWISHRTIEEVESLKQLQTFLMELLDLTETND